MPHPLLTITITITVALALAGPALAEELRVVSISNGDTFTAIDAQQRQVKIRLRGLDAPEKAQPFGQAARKSLGELLDGKIVRVDVAEVDRDRFDRIVARVWVDNVEVNRQQLARGMAWTTTEFHPASNDYNKEVAHAQREGAGLWADPAPVPPWEWRKAEKERRAAKRAAAPR